MVSSMYKFNRILNDEGHDLNYRFSKIDFLSGYGRSRCQIKKFKFDGMFKMSGRDFEKF